jgi:hypothetical protein
MPVQSPYFELEVWTSIGASISTTGGAAASVVSGKLRRVGYFSLGTVPARTTSFGTWKRKRAPSPSSLGKCEDVIVATRFLTRTNGRGRNQVRDNGSFSET